jgi:hypothetical protein
MLLTYCGAHASIESVPKSTTHITYRIYQGIIYFLVAIHHYHGKDEVQGSNPCRGSTKKFMNNFLEKGSFFIPPDCAANSF